MDLKLNHGFDFPKPPLDLLTFGKSVPRGILLRETGFKQKQNCVSKEFQSAAEDKLVLKNHELMHCTLPGSPTRSTFLMVFSPDGKRVASTHGNHNVYVTDLTSGKNINTLSGHPRTPWCIAFHPSSNQILASGCLAGQVRVWDLSGGSEIWTVQSQTVIASIAFHPTDRVLVIATYNELYFWDWSQPEPFAKCHTSNEKEKVRYVAFDPLGHKIITGISNVVNIPSQWDRVAVVVPPGNVPPPAPAQGGGNSSTPGPHRTNVAPDQERRISMCYRSLVEQYDQLVQRYYDLSRSRATPTMDRGTDPMDVDAESSPGYFQPPTTSRTANWRSASQSRASARMSIHHTQRRPIRSRLPGSHRLNSPYLSPETPLRSSRPHSELLSRRRFFQCHRRRRLSCSTYGPNSDTPTNNIGGSGLQYGIDQSSNNSTEPTSTNAADHRVHVRTYEVGQSGPVLPSFSLSHYLQDALQTAATDERSSRRHRFDVPPSSTNDQADSSGSFFVSHRSAFVPRSPSGGRPLPRLNRFNVSPAREPRQESENSADVGVRYGIQLLSRHIDNMQQLCRARLEILQLQQIRRMWEHLQRQIRSLHVAVRDSSTVPISNPEPPHTPASHTRSRETSSPYLPSFLGLRRLAPIPTEDAPPSEGMRSGNRSTIAQEETHVPSSLQPESPYTRGRHPVSSGWETEEEVASTTLSTTASSTEDASLGDGESSNWASASSSSSQASNSNFEPEDEHYSLMSLLPFRRLSGLRRRRLLSAFMRIEREMGYGRGLSSSPVLRFSPTNPFQRLTRDNSCNTNDVPQNSQSTFRSTGRKNNSYNLRNQNYLSRNNEKASQSQASKKTKDECQVKPSSHIESEPGPSTSNGSSTVRANFRNDLMEGSSETPQSGISGLGTPAAGIEGTSKSGNTGKKTDKTLGKKQKLGLPPWRTSTVPENITFEFERLETNRDSTRPNSSEDSQLEEETLRNNNTNAAESRRMSKASSSRKKSGSASLPSSSRSTNVQHTRSTEPMTLRPMIAELEALVHQQRNYQRTQGSGASDGSPSTRSTTTEQNRHRSTSRATGASSNASGLLRNYNAMFRDGAYFSSGSSSEVSSGHHRPSAEERLTSALENETDHVNRLHQRPSGSRVTQRRSGEVEATRLRARQVLSLMVESLTQFFEENGLSGNTPQPGVLDDQIYNLYVLLQLALELTDLLLAQLVSTRHELEHQWTHRLRSPVALDASTGVEPQRVYARTRGSMRGRREYRNMLRLIAHQRHELHQARQTRNEVPPSLPSSLPSSVTELLNRNAEMRNEYIMRVQRFRNSMPQAPPGASAVQESTTNPSQQQQQQQEVFTVPLVRLNDVLVLDTASLNHQPRQRPQSPPLDFPGTVPHPQQLRYLHPRYFYPQHFDSAGRQQDPGIDLRASPIVPEHMMTNDPPTMPTHRIQAWDFSKAILPNISNAQENIVASDCKIHNDASVDISSDGHLLVTLLASGRLSMSTTLGIYSLQWHTLGQCLYTTSFEQNAVSVSLSPISRHLLVGLACRRVAPMSNEYLPMAQIFRLDDAPIPGAKGRLCLLRDVEQGREQGYMSINCIRWAPWPGQGLVYGTNTGQLKILR